MPVRNEHIVGQAHRHVAEYRRYEVSAVAVFKLTVYTARLDSFTTVTTIATILPTWVELGVLESCDALRVRCPQHALVEYAPDVCPNVLVDLCNHLAGSPLFYICLPMPVTMTPESKRDDKPDSESWPPSVRY